MTERGTVASPYLRPLPKRVLLTGLRLGLLWRWLAVGGIVLIALLLWWQTSVRCVVGQMVSPEQTGLRFFCGVHDYVWLPLKGWLVVRGWPFSLIVLAVLALLGALWLAGFLIGQPLLRFAHLKLARQLWRNPKAENWLKRWHATTAGGRFRPRLLEDALELERGEISARLEEAVLEGDAKTLEQTAPELLRLTLIREELAANARGEGGEIRRASALFAAWVQLEVWLAPHALRDTLEPQIARLRRRLMGYALEAAPDAGENTQLSRAIAALSAAPKGFDAATILAEMALMALSREVGENTAQAARLRHRLAAGLQARQTQIDAARLRLELAARSGSIPPPPEEDLEDAQQGGAPVAAASLALAASLSLVAAEAGPYVSHLESLEGLAFAADGLTGRARATDVLGPRAWLLEACDITAISFAPWALADALMRTLPTRREGSAHVALNRADHHWLDAMRRAAAAAASRDPSDPSLSGRPNT